MKLAWYVMMIFGLVLSCGDDKRSSAKENYELKVINLAEEFNQGTEVRAAVELLKDDELAKDETTDVSMVVNCKGKRVTTQKVSLTAGKASFEAFAVTEVGDCSAIFTSSLTKKKTITFAVKAKVTVTLPPIQQPPTPPTTQPPTGTNPQPVDKVPLPTLNAGLTIGKPFSITSKVALKVQPNELCEKSIMLIYDDGSKVIEVLTAGVHVPAVNDKIEGLTYISLSSPPSISSCGKSGKGNSITMSIMPGFPQGLRANVALPSSPPTLASASLSNSGGKIKLAWGTATGFSNGAEIFFSNDESGNEFSKHAGTVNWGNGQSVTSTLKYSARAKALIKVKLSAGVLWLYFSS